MAEVTPESRMPHSPPKGPGIAYPPAPQGLRLRLTPRPPGAQAEVNPPAPQGPRQRLTSRPPRAKPEVNPPPPIAMAQEAPYEDTYIRGAGHIAEPSFNIMFSA